LTITLSAFILYIIYIFYANESIEIFEYLQNQAPEELQTTIVREDMNLDELKGIIPQLYSFRNR